MKLYLSSYRIPTPEDLFRLLKDRPENTHVGIIPNAKDYYADRARNFKINEIKNYLKETGFSKTTVIDLREIRDVKKLDAQLAGIDMLWVSGGNTFCLREEMKLSGFDTIIHKHIDRGLVYVGESAGAVVAGNSLEGIELADEPAFAVEHMNDGLNIIDNYILPHVGSPFFQDSIEEAKELHKNNKTLIELTDDQAYIVDGDTKKITP